MLLLIIAVLSHTCLAQKGSEIDSLITVLSSQKEDTSKANTLNALSWQHTQKGNYEQAKKYAEEALALADKIKFPAGKARAYNNIGSIYLLQGNNTEALKNHLTSLKINESNGIKKGMAASYRSISRVYLIQGDYNEAVKYIFAALKIDESTGNKEGVAARYNDIGNIYKEQGKYAQALKNYYASLRIFESTGGKKNIAPLLTNIGLAYNAMGNKPEALKNLSAAFKIYEELNDKFGVINSLSNIASIYIDQGDYPEALKNLEVSLKLSREIGYKQGVASTLFRIGHVYEKQSNYTEAFKNYLASLKISEDIGYKRGVANSSIYIGKAYIKLKNLGEAKIFINKGLALSKKIGAKTSIKLGYEALTLLDSAMGDWESAYLHHTLYILYRDSLVNEESDKKIIQNQMQYEFDKKEDSLKYQQALTDEQLKQQTLLTQQQQQTLLLKEKEFALISSASQLQQLQIEKDQADFAAQKTVQKAESDNKQGQLILLNKEKAIQSLELNKQKQLKKYLIAGLALFALLSFFIYRNYRNRQNLKLLTLRNKIASDLHDDVGSTLSSISIFSQMAQQQSKEVIPMLETIGESSRKMLDAMADIVWTINPENDQFEKIILRMRSFAYELLGAKNIDFEFIADDVSKMKLPMNVRKNLYLIFKEATNNMVKYSGADKVLFTVKEEKNNLIMQICDNGKGFDTHKLTGGNGLKNMKKRAEEIGGFFLLDSFPGKGTTVQLSVAI